MKTVIIDYGMGNLHSVQKSVHAAAERAGIATQIQLTSRAQDIYAADRVIFLGKAPCPTAWQRSTEVGWPKPSAMR